MNQIHNSFFFLGYFDFDLTIKHSHTQFTATYLLMTFFSPKKHLTEAQQLHCHWLSSQTPNVMHGPFCFRKRKRRKKKKAKNNNKQVLEQNGIVLPLLIAEENQFLIFEIIFKDLRFQQGTITCCSSCTTKVSCRGLIVFHIPTTILIPTKDIQTPSSNKYYTEIHLTQLQMDRKSYLSQRYLSGPHLAPMES